MWGGQCLCEYCEYFKIEGYLVFLAYIIGRDGNINVLCALYI